MITEVRCSGLGRVMACSGFVSVTNLLPDEENDAAKEGTAAGELLSEMIRQRTDTPQIGITASNGVTYDQDMWMHTKDVYADILEHAKGSHIETEERIDWKTQSGITVRGQFDISFFNEGTLHVSDLKYGWGIHEVKGHWQLLGYAIGQVFRLEQTKGIVPERICLKIYQPRPYHGDGRYRTWTITIQELFAKFHNDIEVKMMQITKGDRTLSTGSQCRYCPAAPECPAFNQASNSALDVILADWNEATMSNSDLAGQLNLMTRAFELADLCLKSLKQLAITRLQNNQIVPGWAYEMKFGDRKWKSNVTAESFEILTGIKILKTEMMSPAQAEKAGLHKKFVTHFTERPSKGLDLVRKDILKEAKEILTQPIIGDRK